MAKTAKKKGAKKKAKASEQPAGESSTAHAPDDAQVACGACGLKMAAHAFATCPGCGVTIE